MGVYGTLDRKIEVQEPSATYTLREDISQYALLYVGCPGPITLSFTYKNI